MGKVIFITDQFGPKKIHDSQGLIGVFEDTKNNIVDTDEGLKKNSKIQNLWILTLDDEIDAERVARVRALKTFGSQIKETKNEITINQLSNLRQFTDPNKFNPEMVRKVASEEVDRKVNENLAQQQKDMRRYGTLYSEVCKSGGKYLVDADPVKIKEFEELKVKYNIEEEIEETVDEKVN